MTQVPDPRHPIIATSSRIAYENPWLKIREDKTIRYGNKEGIYGVVETDDSVIICAINDQGELYLVYGYAYPTDTWSWQVPGGGGDKEPAIVAAKRELKEETGIEAENFEELGSLIVSCGLLKEKMSVVVATKLTLGKRNDSDDLDSVREGKFVSFKQIEKMINDKEICDSQSISAIYMVEKWFANTAGV